MTSTDELRKMLDERGVEYEVTFFETFTDTEWCVNDASCTYTDLRDTNSAYLTILDITPEQAIAATLGNETCEVECFDDGVDEGMDGEWFSYAPPTWHLSCGHTSEGTEKPNYCPNCGAKVVDNAN